MSSRYSRDANKELNAKHTEILRGMLKEPHNRMCGDCKRNDARWASTNLGVFMCIRCSGIHRGMGVHISRIKSVDLDTWLPDQVANVQRWGNRRANAYWEAHLREGHIPPDHKMESFIRSKYESKRWVLSQDVPEPETLDPEGETSAPAPLPASATAPKPSVGVPSKSSATTSVSLLDGPPATDTPVRARAQQQAPAASPPPAPAPTPATSNGAGLFDLDFTPEGQAAAQQQHAAVQRKGTKNDILSLFSQPPPPQHVGAGSGGAYGGLAGGFAGMNLGGQANVQPQPQASNPWGGAAQQQQPSTGNNNGFGAFGGAGAGNDPFGAFASPTSGGTAGTGGSSGWGSFASPASAGPAAPASAGSGMFNSQAAWGGAGGQASSDPFGAFSSGTANGGANKPATTKKDDVFGDLWN